MRSSFSLNQKRTQLGIISDPVIPISVLTKYGYQKFDFNEKSPFILGRKDIFSKFNISFDNKNKLVKFIRF